MLLRDYVTAWLGRPQPRLAPTTLHAYESALRLHVVPALGDRPVATLRPPDIRAWLLARLATRPRNSVRAMFIALSTVLADAVLDGECATNAAHGAAHRVWPARVIEAPKALTPDQLRRLLLASDLDRTRWLGPLVRVDSRTGLRLGELLALEPGDIQAASSTLRVERTYHGAGQFGPVKSRRPRFVDVTAATLVVLEARAALGQPWLFANPSGRNPLSPSRVERAVRRAVARAGLPSTCTVHSLRHTYASLLLAAGAPAQWVQRQLGHQSYQLTVDTYGSWFPAQRPDLISLLDAEPRRHPPRPAPRHPARVLPFRRRLRS
jgi:integrase